MATNLKVTKRETKETDSLDLYRLRCAIRRLDGAGKVTGEVALNLESDAIPVAVKVALEELQRKIEEGEVVEKPTEKELVR